MSYFVCKIGHLDPRCYSLIYCAMSGVQMSGIQMSTVQMSGVQISGSRYLIPNVKMGKYCMNLASFNKELMFRHSTSLDANFRGVKSENLLSGLSFTL